MVEQAHMLGFIVADGGGLADVAATSVSGELSRSILMPLEGVFPVEALRAAIDTAGDLRNSPAGAR